MASGGVSGARPLASKAKLHGESGVDRDDVGEQESDDIDDDLEDDDEDDDLDREERGGLDQSDKKKRVLLHSTPFQPMGLDRSSNSSLDMVFAMARAKSVYERLRVMLGMSAEAIRSLLLKQPFKPTHFFEMLNMANITHLDRTLVQYWADARRGDINRRMSTIHAIRDACVFSTVPEIESVLDAMVRVCISVDFSDLAMEYVTLRDMVKTVRASGRCFSVNSLVGFLARVLDNAQEHYDGMKSKGSQFPDELYPGWTDETLQLSWMQYHAFDSSADALRAQLPPAAAAAQFSATAPSQSLPGYYPAAAYHGFAAPGPAMGQSSTFAYPPTQAFPSAHNQTYAVAQAPPPMVLPPYVPMPPPTQPPPKPYAEAARYSSVTYPPPPPAAAASAAGPMASTVVNPQVPSAEKLKGSCKNFQQGHAFHNVSSCNFCHGQVARGVFQACGLCGNPGHGIMQCAHLNEQLPAQAEVLRVYRAHWAALEAKAEQYKATGQPHRGGGRGGHSGYGRPRGGF